MTKREIIRRAYAEAATFLQYHGRSMSLTGELTAEDEALIRDTIRGEIARSLLKISRQTFLLPKS